VNKPFNSFAELVMNCELNADYRIQVLDRGAKTTIICIHGGAIEPLTSELATAIAGDEHNLYDLQGLRAREARQLRIPLARFDEVRLFTLLKRSYLAVSVDGVSGADPLIHLGGSNSLLKQIMYQQLTQSGFKVVAPHTPGAAHDPARFYNAAISGGVLLELSESLRGEMTTEPLTNRDWKQTPSYRESYYRFTEVVRSTVLTYIQQADSNLDRATQLFEEATRRLPRELRSGHHHNE
jgi:phage replication-related protein YjqB (UPF0714/DUF867 family)